MAIKKVTGYDKSTGKLIFEETTAKKRAAAMIRSKIREFDEFGFDTHEMTEREAAEVNRHLDKYLERIEKILGFE